MNPARHNRLSELYQAAMELRPEERAAFLQDACGEDTALWKDVSALLAQPAEDLWFDRPALEAAAQSLASTQVRAWTGRRVHHYEVQTLLGAGGMGEVYRARDTRLDRDVAFKVLPITYSTNAEWLRRFDQEARAAGKLNHPNVLTVYDVGVFEGAPYIVSELLEGTELREQLRPESVSQRRAVEYARQIAAGLAEAHAKGIVHRDLKPENVFVTRDGRVKILDFGLATLKSAPLGGSVGEDAFEQEKGMSSAMGTIGYMSPEQLRGEPADPRSDIFVLGVILYEMLSGRPPFSGDSSAEVANQIRKTELPESMEADLRITPVLGKILRRCLEKTPAHRFQSALDLAFALDALYLPSAPARPEVAPATDPHRGHAGWLERCVWAVTGILLASAVVWWNAVRTQDPFASLFANAEFSWMTASEGRNWDPQLSRDGKRVVFLSDREGPDDAWFTEIGSGKFENRTTGNAPELGNPRVRNVGFSWDGVLITLWVRPQGSAAHTWAVPIVGGKVGPYLDKVIEPNWTADGGRMVYHHDGEGDPIFVVEGSQAPNEIFRAAEGIHCHFPTWSAGGDYIYFVKGRPPDEMDIWRIPMAGAKKVGREERITFHNSLVAYPTLLNDRLLLYIARDDKGAGPWLYGHDLKQGVARRISDFGLTTYNSIAASADGKRLVTTVANPVSSLWRMQMKMSGAPVEESGAISQSVPHARASAPRFSHDSLLYLSPQKENRIFKLRPNQQSEVELLSLLDDLGRIVAGPAVSPDKAHIAFIARTKEQTKLYMMDADGTAVVPIAESIQVRGMPSWSPDSQWIAIAEDHGNDAFVVKIPLNGGAPVKLVSEYSINPVWSPDGTFIVYSGKEIGTRFAVKAVTPDGNPYPLRRDLRLTRGANRYAFVPKTSTLIVLMGGISYKNFSAVDLKTGEERALSNFGREFVITDFDISDDGKEIIFSRQKENSNILRIDLPHS